MDDNAAYDAAKNDPVAARVLDALHEQDARTYNGQSGDIGKLALTAAADLRELVGKEERQRLAALLDEHRVTLTEFVDNPDKMLGLVILLLGLDKP
jgi:hypothetical protein